jgi:hypothetical protein
MLQKRTATVVASTLTLITYLVISAPVAHATEGTGGVVKGFLSCRNDKSLTGVRIQAHTPVPGQQEGVNEAVEPAIVHRSDKTAGTYETSMSTIRGDFNKQGTHLFIYISCNDQPVAGLEQYLYGPDVHVWHINMYNCDEGNCR